jgi:hypothetical protein
MLMVGLEEEKKKKKKKKLPDGLAGHCTAQQQDKARERFAEAG